ncbi:hypothetical protein BAE44_0000665 [Dichanthelium oligosanthes]|uniref:Uncharacterized protein n=1 Tax=Dichanthelium oligosanthes TaxID=888268 RepID=A0A1E5WLS4_9POAL|nr:hypothetical protein BAE44_0000665 [Dichanthelium oligosanthes]
MAATRPGRSDPHLPPEAAARVEAEVRGYFDSVAPRRPAKPQRSDPSEDAGAEADAGDHDLPELRKLRDLEAKPQKLVLDGAGDVDGGEEYVETRYYDGLIGIDKQHHTVSFECTCQPVSVCEKKNVYKFLATGTGFIKVEKPNGSAFGMTSNSYSSASFVRCTSNPATNDWIPSAETVIPASNKPSRSDT